MNNQRPDGQSLRALLEAALAHSLGTSAPSPAAPGAPGSSVSGSPVVVGEIVDTHHPHLPGRVLARWWPSADGERSEWLHHERHLTLARGDRVLVTLPLGWSEWVVTGALGSPQNPAPESTDAPTAASPADATPRLQLEPGQALLIVGHDGQPLLQVRQAPEGLRLELVRDQLEIKAQRRLRLSADSIEIAAGPGGVDVRTEGDAVTRARAIRLN